jgi:muramoyltetrapeptide carboxypeptidase
MIKPKAIRPGATIGLVSPASPSLMPSVVPRAVAYWETLGYKVKIAPNVNKARGLVAGTEAERASDFNKMVRDDTVDAIMVTQGGYGSAQLLAQIDYDAFAANPKVFVGYSDLTSLLVPLHQFTGAAVFHGPDFSRFNGERATPYTKDQFFKAVTDPAPTGEIKTARETKWLSTIASGVAEGPIVGGNVYALCALMGTPYEIQTKGKILMLEDTDLEPWMADNYFCQLRNAGKFDGVLGIVIGEQRNIRPLPHNPIYYADYSFEDVLYYYLKDLGIPVLYGLPLGHTNDMATIPFGANARLDATSKTFEILESGVI